ncbi:metallophosphoesterase [Acidithiobacillus acidisediminis]|uniref:metallophosphoesterase n=1 Tax=Acidithiobacillus acidisediminis TaxID=2937799 RepID=UPI00200C0C43|nr:metallophosphoesterase [Acidithiobacillus sp. S30A2]
MIRIAFASDLHLEHYPLLGGFCGDFGSLHGADLLVIAGDLHSAPSGYHLFLHNLRKRFPKLPVVFVLGNHEYYGGRFPDRISEYRSIVKHGGHAWLLEQDSMTFDGLRILGTTLWSDFAEGWQLPTCEGLIADFRVIGQEDGGPLRAQTIYRVHQKAVTWLDLFFQEPWSGSTLVVTHHAPSYLSQHPRFANSTIGGAFCSNLDDRILEWQPDVWIHGHLHDPVDYRIGKTRVLCNPWGYPDEGREAEFRIVEVGE